MAESSSGLQAPLWRAIAVYRIAALVYVTILVVRNVGALRAARCWPGRCSRSRPAWTVFTTYAYADPARRRPPLLVADLLVTMARDGRQRAGSSAGPRSRTARPTLAVAWHVAPVIAWAVAGGRRGGIAAALAMGATDLVVRAHYDQAAFTGTVLMLLAAIAVGYLVAAGRGGPASGCNGRSSWRPPPGSGNGWPATSTTRCCRCWRWSSGAARAWTGRPASWPGWPASRRRRCAPWSPGTSAPAGRRARRAST